MDLLELSVVIPVFNSAGSIAEVVERVHATLSTITYEIILVDDGSTDGSESVLRHLSCERPDRVFFLILSRNFGEHSAVFAGLTRSRGKYVAILDDDGQNPPEELPSMLASLKVNGYDVVFGKYVEVKQNAIRRWGSNLHNLTARFLLGKRPELYLSSFKIMTRFVVEQLVRFPCPYSYLDGRILQITDRLGQVDVLQNARRIGESGYTLKKLLELWLNMVTGYSLVPLRLAFVVGCFFVGIGFPLGFTALALAWTIGVVLGAALTSTGLSLMSIGLVGEYVGRSHLQNIGRPSFVIRSCSGGCES